MARPRKPTAVLELSGSFKRNPRRRLARLYEPRVVEPLGDPPESLDAEERALWRELGAMGSWITRADRVLVEQTARLWARERRGQALAMHSRLLATNLSRLGLTPADRSRVAAPPAREEGEGVFTALRA